jgi:hypothetical protein
MHLHPFAFDQQLSDLLQTALDLKKTPEAERGGYFPINQIENQQKVYKRCIELVEAELKAAAEYRKPIHELDAEDLEDFDPELLFPYDEFDPTGEISAAHADEPTLIGA